MFYSDDCFALANSVNPDEMPQYVAFHQGLHCVPNNTFRVKKYTTFLKLNVRSLMHVF